MSSGIKILGAAFGDATSDRTFSGVPKYLFNSLRNKGVILDFFTTKQLRIWDVFDNAVDFSKTFRYGRPGINVSWIWRRKTIEKFTKRFMDKVGTFEDYDAVLQVGTHVLLKSKKIKHYCFTDMTITQAVNSPNAKKFSAGRLPKKQHKEAIEIQKEIFSSCEGIFVNSNWTKNSIVGDYNIESKKVYVVGVGVSLQVKPLLQRNYGKHNILFIGRDWRHKGGTLLLDAFSLIKRKFPDATLTIIGCRPHIKEENVKILGVLNKSIDREKKIIEDALFNADVLCVPSIFEAYGICFLEAQLYGVPPVTFEGEGRSDSIKNGKTGILLKERTAKAISDTIIDLFCDPEKIRRMGQAGNDYVINNLTWEHVSERVLNIIRENAKKQIYSYYLT